MNLSVYLFDAQIHLIAINQKRKNSITFIQIVFKL